MQTINRPIIKIQKHILICNYIVYIQLLSRNTYSEETFIYYFVDHFYLFSILQEQGALFILALNLYRMIMLQGIFDLSKFLHFDK